MVEAFFIHRVKQYAKGLRRLGHGNGVGRAGKMRMADGLDSKAEAQGEKHVFNV